VVRNVLESTRVFDRIVRNNNEKTNKVSSKHCAAYGTANVAEGTPIFPG